MANVSDDRGSDRTDTLDPGLARLGAFYLVVTLVTLASYGFVLDGTAGAIWLCLLGLVLLILVFGWPERDTLHSHLNARLYARQRLALLGETPAHLARSFKIQTWGCLASATLGSATRFCADLKRGRIGQRQLFGSGRWTDASTLTIFCANIILLCCIIAILRGGVALPFYFGIGVPIVLCIWLFLGLKTRKAALLLRTQRNRQSQQQREGSTAHQLLPSRKV